MKILIGFLFISFLQFANIVQSGYMGIILGHRRNSGKLVASILSGFASYFGTQVIALFMLFIMALFNPTFMDLFVTSNVDSVGVVKTIIYVSTAIYTVILVGTYFINLKLFQKGVNVD
ncbi:MAG TPA: hypothetical protein DCY94_03180 [Firmicutes bacterium]|nr:hypothetical protein [Bacillota bacterium]